MLLGAGISDGFLVVDRDLTVLCVNEQGAAMLGRSPAELLQQSEVVAMVPDLHDLPVRKAEDVDPGGPHRASARLDGAIAGMIVCSA